jgi:hypothetical protein
VALTNRDITPARDAPAKLLGEAITRIITPKHVYEFVATNP